MIFDMEDNNNLENKVVVNEVAILYTTVSSLTDAEHLANLVLINKLAACVNISTGGKSIYLWNGNIENSDECYLIFKTTLDLLAELEAMIIKNHPYELPAILKFTGWSSQKFSNYILQSLR